MSARSQARVTFQDLLTSRWATSWQAWAIVAPLSMIAILLRHIPLLTSSPVGFIAIAAGGQVVVFVVLVFGSALRRHVSVTPRDDMWIVLVTWVLAGIALGLSQSAGRLVFLGESSDSVLVVGRGVASTVIWLSLATFLIAIFMREKDDRLAIQRLVAATEQAAIAAKGDVSTMRRRLREVVRKMLLPEMHRLALQVRELGMSDSRFKVAATEERVRALSSEVVRGLSHDLAERGTGERIPSAGPPPATPWWKYLYWSRPNPALTFVLLLPFAAVQNSVEAYLDIGLQLAFALVVLALGALICRTAWASVPRVGFTVTVVTWGVTYLSVIVAGNLPVTPVGIGAPPALGALVGLIFTVVASVFTAVVRHSRNTSIELIDREEQLTHTLRLLDEESARLREQVALALHGPVQSRLTAMSLAMRTYLEAVERGENPSLPALVSKLSSLLEAATEDLESMFALEQRSAGGLRAWLDALAARWQPLLVIDAAIAPEAEEILAGRDDIVALVRESLDDAATNASRHGRATRVGLSLLLVDGKLRIVALDDGCGPVGEINPGLCARRVVARGGEWSLEAPPGGGAHVSITIPLQAELREPLVGQDMTNA